MTKYWRSIEELNDPVSFRKAEMRLEVDAKRAGIHNQPASRRDFLKTFGFSVAAASLVASCTKPVHKAIPFLIKPEEVTPGMANYYASSYFEGNEYCSVLVKVRDGRPIKIEGNSLSPVSQQGTSARVQASVLNLYDDFRFKTPIKRGEPTTWEEVDGYIENKIGQLKRDSRKLVLLTSTIISPSTKAVINKFLAENPNAQWLQYDAVSATGILKANELSFGKAFVPDYHFEKAKVIVSFGADFLGTWLSNIEYTKGYSAGRKLLEAGDEMSRHYHFESGMSITGSNADVRIPIKPSEEGVLVASLYNAILKAKGFSSVTTPASTYDLSGLVADLIENEGKSLVVSGSNNVDVQIIINAVNNLLGNYGKTLFTGKTLNTHQGIDSEFETFISELKDKTIAGVICWGVNPVYNHPAGSEIKQAFEGLELSVSFAEKDDETTATCHWVCPAPNYLEAWNDAEPKTGSFSLAQPTISKLFDSRQVQESLLKWSGLENADFYAFLKNYWIENFMNKQSEFADSRMFWNSTLQIGVFEPGNFTDSELSYSENGLSESISRIKPANNGWEIAFYESVALSNGNNANNPWLQELPDPIAKVSWDNFAAVPVNWAVENGIQNESVISVNGIELPVVVQPGQAADTISVALGYGRVIAGKVGDRVGKNMFPLTIIENGAKKLWLAGATIEKAGKTHELAISQTHHSMEGRPIVRETNFDNWQSNPSSGNELKAKHEEHAVTLYPKAEFKGHHWGMAVDLSSCTGCGNCSVSCQAENNVQVIGKEQVRNRRIMHWIRVDRYYSGDPANPEVYNQWLKN
ncbi:MAG TPA: TAT-variant-translocated molybdopterin oxidoreductase, partial [Draconibacterium sp.]|nr:TAT-variant-translocated molybdopterin oxidoreductase [Draconibacterium sp.]